jgi:signal transduction histidine kinase
MPETALRETSTSPALERVMRQVLAMKQARDIEHLVETVWEVLQELDFQFVSCALMLMDEQRDWMTSYNIWDEHFVEPFGSQDHARSLGAGLRLYTTQTSLSDVPSRYQSAVRAWRKGTVERHVLDQSEIRELVRINTERYGGTLTIENYPIRFYLHAPFSHGVFTLRTASPVPDQFAPEQVEFLRRLVEIFSVGYARYREFLQVARDRAVQRVRAEVQSMQRGEDITGVMGLLWEELHRAGIEFDYMSISVNDQEGDFVHLYSVWHCRHRGLLNQIPLPLLQMDLAEKGDLYYTRVPRPTWEENRTETTGIWSVKNEEMAGYQARMERLWQVERWVPDLLSGTLFAMAVPFLQGRLFLAQFHAAAAFIPENLEILEAFAEALGLGFARFFDFQRLERQNRRLNAERALERVRAEVFRMQQSSQITRIVQVIWEELEGLGYELFRCSLSTIDQEKDLYSGYYVTTQPTLAAVVSTAFWSRIGQLYIGFGETPLYKGGPFRRPLIEAWQQGEVYQHLLVDPQEKEAMAAFQQRVWGPRQDRANIDQFCLYVPFAHGMLGVASKNLDPDQFNEEDLALFRRLGEAFDEGYKRFLELRQREIQQGVERLRAEVGAMRRSSDIVEVVVLLAQQLRDLGMEFRASAISLIDEEVGLVRLYSAGPAEEFRLMPGADTHATERAAIERLAEKSTGPLWIRDIAPGFDLAYTAEPLADSPALEERGRPPRIVRRTEEEAQGMLERYRQRWTPAWTLDCVARTVIRVPFSHGSVAITAMEPGRYNQRDVDLVSAFADALSLGFTRFLDFQRLEQQNRALEAASRVKSEFLANMSHELRTPMNSIINFSSLILEGVYGEIPEDLRDAVEEIDRNSGNLLALINDILDISKIEAGAMQLQLARCAPEGFVETALAAMERKAEEKGLELVGEVQGELPLVMADERRITLHVLVNLVKNAIKFTREGQVRVGAKRTGDEVLFWVADTGIGIPKEEQERIFETFHQVDSSITREAEGTGLGLAIARKFVELHGGRIWVESEPGKGSTFWFTLPVKH